MDEPDLTLHPHFEDVFGQHGGLLDVSASSELHLNIGRLCTGVRDTVLADNEVMTVTAVQDRKSVV